MKNIMRASLLCSALMGASLAFGFGSPKHSTIDVATKTSGENLTIDFKVNAKEGMKITFDAPWSLELKSHPGLTFANAKAGKDELDEKLPGFSLTTQNKPSAKSGDVEYRLTAFICTKDKTQCFREVHKGKAPWKAP